MGGDQASLSIRRPRQGLGTRSLETGKAMEADPWLGSAQEMRVVREVFSRVLQPRLGRAPPPIGRFQEVAIRFVAPDYHYHRRMDILRLLPRSAWAFYPLATTTTYFRRSGSLRRGVRRVRKYRTLFQSIRDKGLIWSRDDARSVPWLFVSQESVLRMDGHHRASIARLLGNKTMTVLLFTPADIAKFGDLPEDLALALREFHEPDAELLRRISHTPPATVR